MPIDNVKNELEELAKALGITLPGQEQAISKQNYRMPAEGQVISQHHPVSQGGFATPTHPQGHFGLDIMGEVGTPIYSIGPGIVSQVYNESNNPKGGNAIKISHEEGAVVSYYAHLNEINVSVGDEVNQNTQIGTMGTSGMIYNGKKRHTAPHLHYQVKINGTDVNPSTVANKPIGSFSRMARLAEEFIKKLGF
jgi:murein DD-endopeptidase MepM/ murein hydrolase activator NlpD